MAESYTSPFIDKEAEQKELDRKNKLDIAMIGAGAMPTAGSPFVAGSASSGAGPMGAPSGGPVVKSPEPSAFDAFTKLLNDTDPSLDALKKKSVDSAQKLLDSPGAAFDQGAAVSRDDLGRAIQSSREAQKEDLIKTYGANASQVLPQLNSFDQSAILQSRDLNRRLAADRSTAVNAGMTSAIQSAMGILGQQSAEQLGKAGLSLSGFSAKEGVRQFDVSTSENTRQFDTSLAASRAEASLGRKFTTEERQAIEVFQKSEREGSQGFASAEASLGRKFTTEERTAIQAFQKAEREGSQVYASAEASLGRKFTTEERVGIQAYQTAEREGAQDFASAEALLGRKFTTAEREAIQNYQTTERLSVQDFTAMMTEKGYVHDNELEIMRQNHAKELQATGISADQAKQISDQKHQELIQERDQAHETSQAELTRKWSTGERIESQDWQKSVQASEFIQQDKLAQLQAITQKAIAQGGWDNDLRLQAEKLTVEGVQAQKDRDLKYLMFVATESRESEQFANEFNLNRKSVLANIASTEASLAIATKQLGITEDQWKTTKADANFQKDLELAQYGIELWNGEDPAALEPFVTKLAETMGAGLGLDPAALDTAIKATLKSGVKTTEAGSKKEQVMNFGAVVDKSGGFANADAADKFKADMIRLSNTAGGLPADKIGSVADNSENRGLLSAGNARLEKLGISKAARTKHFDSKTVGFINTHTVFSASRVGMDYSLFANMLSNGLNEADARAALTSLIGPDRSNAAFKLEEK